MKLSMQEIELLAASPDALLSLVEFYDQVTNSGTVIGDQLKLIEKRREELRIEAARRKLELES